MSASECRTSPRENPDRLGLAEATAESRSCNSLFNAPNSSFSVVRLHRNVVGLVERSPIGGRTRQQVCLQPHCRCSKSPGLSAIAVDEHRLVTDERGDPFRNHGGIRALGILTRAKHIEVAQTNGGKIVGPAKVVVWFRSSALSRHTAKAARQCSPRAWAVRGVAIDRAARTTHRQIASHRRSRRDQHI